MKPRAIFGSAVASLSILVLGWQLGVQPSTVTASTSNSTTTSTTSPETSTTSDADAGTPTDTSTDTSTSGESYTGTTIAHEYGTVTVTVTVADGVLTEAVAELSITHDRSENINARAVPLLRDEVLTAQSADVSMISGATYTSEAYLESLQSALDQAGV